MTLQVFYKIYDSANCPVVDKNVLSYIIIDIVSDIYLQKEIF